MAERMNDKGRPVTLREWWRLFVTSMCFHRWHYMGHAGALAVYRCEHCGMYVKLADRESRERIAHAQR